MNRLTRIALRLEQLIDRPWALPLLAFLAFLDVFVLVVPVDGILVSSVMLRTRRWFSIAFWFSLTSTLGLLLLATIARHWGVPLVEWIAGPHLFETAAWKTSEDWITRFGALALPVLIASPLPQQPPVFFAALARMPIWDIAAMAGLGKLVKYLFFAWLASHSPKLLKRFKVVQKEMKQLE